MGKGQKEQEETELSKTQAAVAQDKWNRVKKVYSGVRDQYMQRATGLHIKDGKLVASDSVHSPLNADGGTKTDTAMASAASYQLADATPVNPNAGGYLSKTLANEKDRLAFDAGKSAQVARTQQDNVLRGISNIAALGTGQQRSSLQALNSASDRAFNVQAQAAKARADRDSAISQGTGLLLGQVFSDGWLDKKQGNQGSLMMGDFIIE